MQRLSGRWREDGRAMRWFSWAKRNPYGFYTHIRVSWQRGQGVIEFGAAVWSIGIALIHGEGYWRRAFEDAEVSR